MTEQQQTLFDELFTRYGSPTTDTASKTINIYCPHPDQETKISELAKDDKRATEDIERLEKHIEMLKAYRVAVAERYNYLATAPLVPIVELKRQKSYHENKVYYFLSVYSKDANNNQIIPGDTRKYSGKERNKAIEDFYAYVSSHPGIISNLDIDKPSWER